MSAPALPYAFAKAHGILVAGQGADHAQLLLREGASLEALAEVRRSLGLPLQIENVSRAVFEARLSEVYSGTDGNAAEVVADVGQEVDLTQLMTELPAVEDLLETQDDAPIIRMINALLTQAVRQAASDTMPSTRIWSPRCWPRLSSSCSAWAFFWAMASSLCAVPEISWRCSCSSRLISSR